MTSVVKQGYMKRYSKSILSGGWQSVYVILYSDSNLVLYKRQGDNEIKGKVHMKEVAKRFAYGQYTDGFEGRPSVPSGYTYEQMLAIPTKNNSKAKVYFLLCCSESDLHDWMAAIVSTLPEPKNKGPSQSAPPTSSQPVPHSSHNPSLHGTPPMGNPPPYSPGPPMGMPQPGNIGFNVGPPTSGPGYPQGGYQQPPYPGPPPQGYPQQQYQQHQQHGSYPQAYPQQGYGPPPPPPQGAYGAYSQPHYSGKSKGKGFLNSNTGKVATGLIGGAALGYGASKLMGGFGGWGFGHHGSWSSLSSFGSCGSFGSFD